MMTVVFATYNGEHSLAPMLEGFEKLQPPTGGWKLLAVDNGSTDGSREVLLSFKDRLPITILECAKRGKNCALNSAIPHFDGDLVAFTDDDVIPRPDWLRQLRAAADSWPEYGIFGGAIRPHWLSEPEPWLVEAVEPGAAYGITDSARELGEVSPTLVWGGNMAVRAGLFLEDGHCFKDDIGPGSGHYAMGSETEFNIRMTELGVRCCFVPAAIVAHMIPGEYLTAEWLGGRAFRAGRGYWLRWRCDEDFTGPRWFGAPRYLYGNLIRAWTRWAIARLSDDQAAVFAASWEKNKTRGMIAQARQNQADQ